MTQAEIVKREVDRDKSMYMSLCDLEGDGKINVTGSYMFKHFFSDGSAVHLDIDDKWLVFNTEQEYSDFIAAREEG